jgi:hypothetical protein
MKRIGDAVLKATNKWLLRCALMQMLHPSTKSGNGLSFVLFYFIGKFRRNVRSSLPANPGGLGSGALKARAPAGHAAQGFSRNLRGWAEMPERLHECLAAFAAIKSAVIKSYVNRN